MHAIHKVVGFEQCGTYTLRVQFDDSTEQTIDFEPVLGGELFRPLRDPAVFQRVSIDPEVQTLDWPNGADFDPAMLHDWPVFSKELAERARHWELISAGASE
jgi:hypothetical protein